MSRKHKSARNQPARRSGSSAVWVAVALVAVVAAGWWAYDSFTGPPEKGRSFTVQGGEMRPVLDPFNFPNRNTFMAYAAAKQYPQAMDEVFCYCNCDRPPFYHKSLLSCFATYHGST